MNIKINKIIKIATQSLKYIPKSLTNSNRYSYISPVDKPVLSLALTSFHQLSSQFMLYSYIESSICPQFSVLIGAFAFRLAIQPICSIIRGFTFTNKNNIKIRDYVHQRYHDNDRATIKWIDRIFVLDAVRDLQHYGIIKQDINKTIWMYYRPGVLAASAMNLYLTLNFLRGAHQIISNPIHQLFCQDTLYLTNLAIHDPKYITPIAIMITTFVILKKSRHTFLIHINHPGNFMYCFNFAFMAGLLFVPLPGIYHFAVLGLSLGHITIRTIKYFKQDSIKLFNKFVA